MNLKTINLLEQHRQVIPHNLGQLTVALNNFRLQFTMQQQTQSNWCWAANATSVSIFYTPSSAWTQCKVANACQNKTTCCSNPSGCNQYGYLNLALEKTSNFNGMITGTITFAQIQTEINAGRPIGTRTAWSGGGAHFLCIIGYAVISGTNYVYLDDPIYGASCVTLSSFTTNYRGSGTWTHTYLTKRPPSTMNVILPGLKQNVLDAIRTIRPGVITATMDIINRAKAVGSDNEGVSLTLPHHVFVMDLDKVAKGKLSKDKGYTRVLEADNTNIKALYDIDENKGGTAEVRNIISSGEQLSNLQSAMDIVAEVTDKGNKQVEMHFIDIPALYVEAVWLNYDGKDKDVFIPTRTIGDFEAQKAYPNKDFMKLLQEAAAKIPDMKGDDLLGG